MDLVKLLNDIKYLKLITKFHFKPSVETNFAIHHCKKSILDLDQIWKSDEEN